MGKTIIVTRHPALVSWLGAKGISGEVQPQASPDMFCAGDTVVGVLPLNLIEAALRKGCRVIITVLPQVSLGERGKELSPDEMDKAGAKLVEVVSLELREVA